ncbi:MAG TPA: dienelactone hydrolase family protein [Polyangiaceae bacterium]
MSRREALLVLLVTAACRSGTRSAPSAAASAAGQPAAPGLTVAVVTQMPEQERGGTAVVLLHGYGAQGDDLVSLARALQRPRTRFILPAAPLSLPGGGRAWWDIEASDRPRYVTDEAGTEPLAPNPELEAARRGVQAVLARTVQLYAPDELFIAGFSQGAMLSLDIALAGSPPVQRVAVLSGALLSDALAQLATPRRIRPAIFISHGLEDTRLPFSGAERMKAELEQRGFSVTFEPFTGGHEIPDAVMTELRSFFFG